MVSLNIHDTYEYSYNISNNYTQGDFCREMRLSLFNKIVSCLKYLFYTPDLVSIDNNINSAAQLMGPAMVHPCYIDGHLTLVYPRELPQSNPTAFQIVRRYALNHGLQIKADRRADFISGVKRVKDKRFAQVISVLALSISIGLISPRSLAADSSNSEIEQVFHENPVVEYQIESRDIDLTSYHTEAELAEGLLQWLRHYSSFNIDEINVPTINKVSASEIADIAFGGEVPLSVEQGQLKIFGLYNFQNKTVYLLESVDLETIEGKAILLHELVHYLQYETGLDKNVKQMVELEGLAYQLEARFLDVNEHQHGISAERIDKLS